MKSFVHIWPIFITYGLQVGVQTPLVLFELDVHFLQCNKWNCMKFLPSHFVPQLNDSEKISYLALYKSKPWQYKHLTVSRYLT